MKKLIFSLLKKIMPDNEFQMWKWRIASKRLVRGDSTWAKNAKYDIETYMIMERVLKKDSNAIDIGSSTGKFIRDFNFYSPKGTHYAFEPIPKSFESLKRNHSQSNINLFNIALSNTKGLTSFNIAANKGYSGLKATESGEAFGSSEKIEVQTDLLDDIIPESVPIDFIKIDVEGAEYWVLEGALKTLIRTQPVVVFEFQSHAKAYGVKAKNIYQIFEKAGLRIWNTEYYLAGKEPYSEIEFECSHRKGYEFYFVAAPYKTNDQSKIVA